MLKRKVLGFIVVAVLIPFTLVLTGCGSSGAGDPTPNTDWYTSYPSVTKFFIASADDLAGLAQLVNDGTDDFSGDEIFLTADLDLSAYSGDNGWTPIGSNTFPFKGNFDGSGRTVSNIFINSNDDYVGLFGHVEDGTIGDVRLTNVNISAGKYVGGLAGYVDSAGIFKCSATGEVSGTGDCVGGLIGELDNGGLSNCYSTCTVKGKDDVGGLTGALEGSYIADCYSTGAVDGYNSVGGLAGDIYDASVTKCYATGEVSANLFAGGLVGIVYEDGYLQNSVALNQAIKRKTGSNTNFGRVAGDATSGAFSPNGNSAFEDMELPDGITAGNNKLNKDGADLTIALAKTQTTYDDYNWDFNPGGIWKMGVPDYPLPVLYWQPESSYPELPAHLE